MKTVREISAKRQELDRLRHAITHTMGPPHHRRGMGLGLVLAAFVTGVMVQRWGWRPLVHNAASVGRWAGSFAPAAAQVMALMHE